MEWSKFISWIGCTCLWTKQSIRAVLSIAFELYCRYFTECFWIASDVIIANSWWRTKYWQAPNRTPKKKEWCFGWYTIKVKLYELRWFFVSKKNAFSGDNNQFRIRFFHGPLLCQLHESLEYLQKISISVKSLKNVECTFLKLLHHKQI